VGSGRGIGVKAHGLTLRGREGDVGDVVLAVAAEEWEECDTDVEKEEKADCCDQPPGVGGVLCEAEEGASQDTEKRPFQSGRLQ
jgi:hypothetical protein